MFRRWWATILFWLIVVVAFAFIVGPSKSFQDCIGDRHSEEAYKALQEKVSFFVKAIPWTRLQTACGFVAANENTGAITGIAGVAVAFFTFTLWLSTHRLWKAGEKQAEITKIMADAAILGNRAFVQITPMWETDQGHTKAGASYKFATRMENFGKTSANNLKNHIDYRLIKGALPDSFVFPDNDPPMATSGVLGIGQPLMGPHIPPNRYITANEIAQIQRGQLNLYFFGWVKYFDGFPGTPERITKFCYEVRITGNMTTPVVFPPHWRHNCADEGCDETP